MHLHYTENFAAHQRCGLYSFFIWAKIVKYGGNPLQKGTGDFKYRGMRRADMDKAA